MTAEEWDQLLRPNPVPTVLEPMCQTNKPVKVSIITAIQLETEYNLKFGGFVLYYLLMGAPNHSVSRIFLSEQGRMLILMAEWLTRVHSGNRSGSREV